MFDTTIAAISTPAGLGGIGVIRLSGAQSLKIISKIFKPYSGRNLDSLAGYSGILGNIHSNGSIIDQAIVFRYKSPKSYTGEDVIEISCHGGSLVTKEILRLVIDNGGILAEAGEFTKRAFLNGKMDLISAEGVIDVINADSTASLKAANNLREGILSAKIDSIANKILNQSAHLAAWSDYPEEDMEMVDMAILSGKLSEASKELKELIRTFDYGRIIKEGITTAIVGKPNVGKSTLMNILSGYETSIVSNIPGTTRDVVREVVKLGELTLNLADTAGIRDTNDAIERVGVERSKNQLENARLVLAIFDNSTNLDEEDKALVTLLKNKPSVVAIVNKGDLPTAADLDYLANNFSYLITISAKEETGIPKLISSIKAVLDIEKYDTDSGAVVMNERQRQSLIKASDYLDETIADINIGMTLDALTVSLDSALEELMVLTGKQVHEEVVGQVFAQFCVGK